MNDSSAARELDPDVLDALAPSVEGEVLTDDVHRRLYATDASVYQVLPLGVVRPRHHEDCAAIVRFAAEHGVPLIPRAAGTSLAGQCVGQGLVIDVSRHMTTVLDVDPVQRSARVQPGVILDDLNDQLAEHGLMFGPETSTSNRCMIGGMVGNNAAGSHSIVHGTTRDHVLALRAVLADGSEAGFGVLDDDALAAKRRLDTLEGAIHREVVEVVEGHRDVILAGYPDPSIIRRNNGYALDHLARTDRFEEGGAPLNVASLLCGSEGTLALVTEITVNLIPVPTHNRLVAAHFQTLDEATHGTVMALEHEPSAVELMDGTILDLSLRNPEALRNRWWVEGEPGAVLAVEFYDEDPDALHGRCETLIQAYRDAGMGYAFPVIDSARVPQVWAVRKAGLGLLTGMPGDRKPVTIIEDVAVAPSDLPGYVRRMQALMEQHDADAVYYGHASVGELHVRPALSLRDPADLQRFRDLGDAVADLTAEFGASLAGEHGVGRLRSVYLERVLGPDVVQLQRRIKRAFDPQGLFNPGKIVDALPNDEDLRVQPGRAPTAVETWFDWSADHGFQRAAEKCNGAGACRKSAGRGTMCPSYMATGEELHSTRGRANLLRQLIDGGAPDEVFAGDELVEALDLCLSCKGCAGECPSSVDVARLKAEVLQHRHDLLGTPLSTAVLGEFGKFANLARLTPGLASAVSNMGAVKRLLDVDPRRTVPRFARQTFHTWFGGHTEHANAGERGEIVLLADEFTNHTDPAAGITAVEYLEAAGYRITVPKGLDSGRTQISKGLLRKARAAFRKAVRVLAPYAREGVHIVGVEPSAILGFRDEAPDLVGDDLREDAEVVASQALLFEEFVAREAQAGHLDLLTYVDAMPGKVLLHGHCHAKALVGVQPLVDALSTIPGLQVDVIPSGCCGMAGSFGYHHYDLSMQVGELVLFPAVRDAAEGAVIVAPGTSCRHQIADGTGREALHPAQVLRGAIER